MIVLGILRRSALRAELPNDPNQIHETKNRPYPHPHRGRGRVYLPPNLVETGLLWQFLLRIEE